MKILVVVDGIWPPSIEMTGMKAIYQLQKHLSNLGLEIHILTSIEKWTNPYWREWFEKEYEEFGIHFHWINSDFKKFPRIYFYYSKLSFFFKVLRLHKKYNFDIIHEYSSSPVIINRSYSYKFFLKAKTVHTLCTNNTGFFSSPKLFFGKIDKIICASEYMLTQFKKYSENNSICYLPIGIDVDEFTKGLNRRNYRKELRIFSTNFAVLYLGLLDKRKGIYTLLDAIPAVVKKYPNTIFIIATNAREGNFYHYSKNKKEVFYRVKDYRENIRFLEGKQDIPSLFSAIDTLVFPLNTSYGTLVQPSVLIEGMVSGKAIVVSDLPELKSLIKQENNGLAFERGNSMELALAISRLLSDEVLKERLSHNAKHIDESYDIKCTAKRVKKIYQDL